MIDALFLPYVLAPALIPPLVWWRWGLVGSPGATVLELMLVPLVFYLLEINHLLPDLSQGRPWKHTRWSTSGGRRAMGIC